MKLNQLDEDGEHQPAPDWREQLDDGMSQRQDNWAERSWLERHQPSSSDTQH